MGEERLMSEHNVFTQKDYDNIISSYFVSRIGDVCLVITDKATMTFDKTQLRDFIKNLHKIYKSMKREEKTDARP